MTTARPSRSARSASVEILLLERDRRVEQQNDDLGEAHGAQRVGDGELLQLVHHARFAAQACGVEEFQLAIAPRAVRPIESRVRPGSGPGQQPILAEDAVEQRRLAGVGAAEHGDAQRLGRIDRRPVLVLVKLAARRRPRRRVSSAARLRQNFAQRLVEIGRALAMLGRDRDRIAEAEFIGVDARRSGPAAPSDLLATRRIGLSMRRSASAKWRSAAVTPTRASIMNSTTSQSCKRRLGLRAHAAGKRGGVALLQPRRVDDGEGEVAERRLALAPVAGHAGLVVDQRELAADEPVEQRRLADVGAADDGDFGGHDLLCGRRRLRGDEAEQRLGGAPIGGGRFASPITSSSRLPAAE